jgi:hypothetical protein
MRKRTWTKLLVVAGTLALIASAAVPAVGKGKPASTTVAVELWFDGAGVATSCSPDLPDTLTMTQDRKGLMRTEWESANTDIEIVLPIPWSRNHPTPQGDYPFFGCHGGSIDGSAEGFQGFFMLDPGADGGVLLSSLFDYYWEFEAPVKGKSNRTVQTVLEMFSINAYLRLPGGVDFDWSASGNPQTVTGSMELRRFEKTGISGGVWTSLGTAPVTITITISET